MWTAMPAAVQPPPSIRARARRLRRARRAALVAAGTAVIGLGVVIAPLPGPGGVPVMAAGLMLVLRNSTTAKRGFVRLHRRHPRVIGPVRRVLRSMGRRR